MAYSPPVERSPVESHSTMATSIPIRPIHAPYGNGPNAERSPRIQSPSAGRSPTQASLSQHRVHPYPRRQSLSYNQQQQQQHEGSADQGSRIYLPPPNSVSPLNVLHEHGGRDRDPRESRDTRDPRDYDREYDRMREMDRDSWRDSRRPSLSRNASDSRFATSAGDRSSMQLPPFASFSASSSPGMHNGAPLTPTGGVGGNMGPPRAVRVPSPVTSRPASPKPFGMPSLRPSYSFEPGLSSGGPSANSPSRTSSLGLSGPSLSAPNCYRNDLSPPGFPHSGGNLPDHSSPPVRGVQNLTTNSGNGNGYSPEPYMQPLGGRARSHSAASALSRQYARSTTSSDGGDWVGPGTPREAPSPYLAGASNNSATSSTVGTGGTGGGQSRRLAHLMSEQKRRESINTGFQALRTALPSSIPTDSKAIILRKAVTHITHLEGLLRKAGIAVTTTNFGRGAAKGEFDDEGDNDMVDGQADMETDAADDKSKVLSKAGWEDVQVEDIAVDRKPVEV